MADDSSQLAIHIRPEMVEAAVRFMKGPKVRDTPIEEQNKFLKLKGLTEDEIRLGHERLALQLNSSSASSILKPSQDFDGAAISNVNTNINGYRWRNLANSVVIVGGLSYAGYKLVRKYLLPRFFGIVDEEEERTRRVEEQVNDLQNSLKFVMDSVQQTLQSVQQQQASLSQAVSLFSNQDESNCDSHQMRELKGDISVIKSLLLNRNQFAPLPLCDATSVIPCWQTQQSNVANITANGTVYETPPVTVNGFAHATHDDQKHLQKVTKKSDLEDPEEDSDEINQKEAFQ